MRFVLQNNQFLEKKPFDHTFRVVDAGKLLQNLLKRGIGAGLPPRVTNVFKYRFASRVSLFDATSFEPFAVPTRPP